VRCICGDAPGLARPELPLLLGDAKDERAGEDDSELFVLVPMLGDDGARIELDDRQRDPLAVDDAAEDSVPDLLRRNCSDVVEGAQGGEIVSS
jgi:hypothetical protein